MTNIKKSRISIFLLLLICTTVIASFQIFADEDLTKDCTLCTTSGIAAQDHKQYLEEAVIKLMEEGKLSKEKVEKILEYKKKKTAELNKDKKALKKKTEGQRKKGSLLRDLVHDRVITEAEAQAIKAKLREMKAARLDGGLQGLVDRGVLTGEDIDNIRSYMLKVREERKEEVEKLSNMTPAKRKEYFESHKKENRDIISRMVEDKIITKEQAAEIKKAIPGLDKPRFKKSN